MNTKDICKILDLPEDTPLWEIERVLTKLVNDVDEIAAQRITQEEENECTKQKIEDFVQCSTGCNQFEHVPGCEHLAKEKAKELQTAVARIDEKVDKILEHDSFTKKSKANVRALRSKIKRKLKKLEPHELQIVLYRFVLLYTELLLDVVQSRKRDYTKPDTIKSALTAAFEPADE